MIDRQSEAAFFKEFQANDIAQRYILLFAGYVTAVMFYFCCTTPPFCLDFMLHI